MQLHEKIVLFHFTSFLPGLFLNFLARCEFSTLKFVQLPSIGPTNGNFGLICIGPPIIAGLDLFLDLFSAGIPYKLCGNGGKEIPDELMGTVLYPCIPEL